jgi:lysophospholipase L1-like esterase
VDYGAVDAKLDAKVAPVRVRVATSDDAHPTAQMYKVLARQIAETLRSKFELGALSASQLK